MPRAPQANHLRDESGRVLQIAVHHHDGVALRGIESGGQRHLMSEVTRERMDAHAPITGCQPVETLQGAIFAAIIDTKNAMVQPRQGGDYEFNWRLHEPGAKNVLGQKIEDSGENEGRKVLLSVIEQLQDLAKVEANPMQQGKRMSCTLAPR